MSRARLFTILLVLSLAVIALPQQPSQAQDIGNLAVPPGLLVAGDETGLFTFSADGSGKTYLVEDGVQNCWLRDGKWSPDGSRIIYTRICGGESPADWHGENRTASVYLYDLSSGENTEISPNNGLYQDYAGAWHPSGTQVMIYSNRVMDRYNLYLVDVPGGDSSRVTDFQSDMGRVSWDPTGRYLLYNRYIADFNQIRWEIRAMDTTLRNEVAVAVGLTPNWSPDGQWITYATSGEAGEPADVYIMPADCIFNGTACNPDADARNVTYTPDINEREPIFSPDQTQIVYLRDTDPNPSEVTWDVFRQDLRTGLLQNMTNTPDQPERHSSWEPVQTPRTNVAANLPIVVSVNRDSVNLRGGASTDAEIVGVTFRGQLVFVQGATADGTWYRITLPEDGSSAWIFASLTTEVEGDPATLPLISP